MTASAPEHFDVMPRRIARTLGAFLTALVLASAGFLTTAVIGPTAANAHDVLVHVGGEIDAADPTQITLTLGFNNVPVNVGGEVQAYTLDGTALSLGELKYAGRQVHQVIEVPEMNETITVHWRVVSSDGHPISDSLAFEVREVASGTEFAFVDLPDPLPGIATDGESAASPDTTETTDSNGAENDTGAQEHDPTVMAMFLGGAVLVVGAAVFIAVIGSRKRREAIAREALQGDE